jgi:hypothetical protein
MNNISVQDYLEFASFASAVIGFDPSGSKIRRPNSLDTAGGSGVSFF